MELPPSALQVWSWFLLLNAARGSNGFGVNPLNYTEIKAFFDLEGIYPESWELDLIRRFDRIACAAYAKKIKDDQKKSEKAPARKR